MAVKARPEGYHTITPYLVVPGARALIDFLKRAFGAEEPHELMAADDGSIMHAEVRIGDSVIMMGESSAQWPPMPAMLYLYLDDVDAAYRRALEAGATSIREPADQFYGDRNATVKDPSGNLWCIAVHKEDVSREEMARRAEAYTQKQKS
ncbi:MAG: VOC family protein [Bryobacteraceae bacterium]|nr:VOC family protein [Bryobacteraceae bacterium]